MTHMGLCLEIAANAATEGKRYSLAIAYDELCRKEWSQKAARGSWTPSGAFRVMCVPLHAAGERDFDIHVVSLSKDKEILDRARIAYSAATERTKSAFLDFRVHTHACIPKPCASQATKGSIRRHRPQPGQPPWLILKTLVAKGPAKVRARKPEERVSKETSVSKLGERAMVSSGKARATNGRRVSFSAPHVATHIATCLAPDL